MSIWSAQTCTVEKSLFLLSCSCLKIIGIYSLGRCRKYNFPFLTSEHWFKHLNLQLLLLWFVNYRVFAGATDKPVSGILGGDATLLCESDATDIFRLDLSRIKSIIACQNETCDAESDSQNGRVFKEGVCGFIIKGLRLSDAGKYILRVYNHDDQTLQRTYQLCIQYTISVKKGEPLKLDVLLSNADKVEHKGKRTTGGKVVWSRRWSGAEATGSGAIE
ncbi:uncharacterized protein LOC130418763 [Triplophysa dalaica]|uniref:uncharacterized protein LOC130418763 n=1 Tax=Triplophysa dalaica TaxID=1582913 RepID=UPI0024DF507B|nr:uncharacterized protein LOC130418763 [Triplophysa dalaica]